MFHFIVSTDGSVHVGPTAIPALGRENYHGLQGIDLLQEGMQIGRLDDVRPSRGGPQIAVAAFVFAVPATARLVPSGAGARRESWSRMGMNRAVNR